MALQESIERLRRALDGLPRDYRFVVEQYDLQSHPVETVAESLSLSVGAVFMLRKRAHRLLSDLLRSSSA